MSSGWTGISEGQDTGNEVEAKLTSAFDNLDKDVVAVDNKANTIGLALGFTKRIGVDVDTLIAFGLYEVDTNLPSPILLGELSVVMINGTALVVQTLMDTGSHYEYERVSGDGGAHWTPWVETGTSLAMSATIAAFTDTATKEYVNNSIINRYSGLNHPDIDLGKEGDKYHQFQTSADVDIQTGTSSNDYYHIYCVFHLVYILSCFVFSNLYKCRLNVCINHLLILNLYNLSKKPYRINRPIHITKPTTN